MNQEVPSTSSGLNPTPDWKDQFPVSWAEDAYVTRREFTKSLVMVSFATFAASGALAAMAAVIRARGPVKMPGAEISGFHTLAIGSSRVFHYPDERNPCLLVRLSTTRYAAYSQKCTHLGCPVLFEPDLGQLRCPCHEGFFSAQDGRVLAGPPQRPLPRILLEKRGSTLWAVGVDSGPAHSNEKENQV